MTQKILIIGSEGFIGKSYIKYHKKHNNQNEELFMIDIINIEKKNYFKCDITDFEKVYTIIQKIKPNEIYIFAGSFSNLYETDYLNNVLATKNIFDSIIKSDNLDCKILINGSAAEYGYIKDFNNPISEQHLLNPISIYGLSKVFQTYLAKMYFLQNNVKVFITRPFNIIGFGISNKLFIGKLIDEITTYLEKKSKIFLGNLNNERDYIDIEDLISAYDVIVNKGKYGEIYNIGSGISVKIQNLLELFLTVFEIKDCLIEQNTNKTNKYDVPKIIADISKLKQLNWNAKITIENSIQKIKNAIIK